MNQPYQETRKRLYRSQSDKVIGGVCGGLGEYFGIDPIILRIVAALTIVFSSIFPGLVIYFILVLAIPTRPRVQFTNHDQEDLYYTMKDSPAAALARVKNRFDALNKRLQRLESIVTSKDWEFEEEYRKLSRES